MRYDQSGSGKNEYPPYLAFDPAEPGIQTHEMVRRLAALDADGNPGYSTRRKPVKAHTLAYGSLFEGSSSSKATALSVLQGVQYYGGVQDSASTPLESDKIIIGTSEQRITKMQNAFSKIMQDGYSVTPID